MKKVNKNKVDKTQNEASIDNEFIKAQSVGISNKKEEKNSSFTDSSKFGEEVLTDKKTEELLDSQNDGPNEGSVVNEKIIAAETKTAQIQDQYLRLNAEFENYKKRMIREKTERIKYLNMDFVKDLLPSIDSLERAISHAGNKSIETDEGMLEGLEMVYKGLQETFSKHGIRKIESLDKEFDPYCHQAVGMLETKDTPENHIVEECQTGYFLHDRIIRPAMVRVSGKG